MVTQRFPRTAPVDPSGTTEPQGELVHHEWPVDVQAACETQPWSRQAPERLSEEVDEMGQHFPRWLLTLADDGSLLRCRACKGMLVFDQGIRCVLCGTELKRRALPRSVQLAWFGLMPPIGIDNLSKIRGALVSRPPPEHVVGHHAQLGHYLLTPLLVVYPEGFPSLPPQVGYLPGFFSIPGVPSGVGHQHHMLGRGVMCLFAPGQWRPETTVREVLQQRAYPHVVKLLNFANGKHDAFSRVS